VKNAWFQAFGFHKCNVCRYNVVDDAVSVAVKPDGSGMYTGHKDGKVREWDFPAAGAAAGINGMGASAASAASAASGSKGAASKKRKSLSSADSLTAADAGAVLVPIGDAHHAGSAVDCIRILPGDTPAAAHRLATKSVNGAMQIFDTVGTPYKSNPIAP
jgi:hypothetical protein